MVSPPSVHVMLRLRRVSTYVKGPTSVTFGSAPK